MEGRRWGPVAGHASPGRGSSSGPPGAGAEDSAAAGEAVPTQPLTTEPTPQPPRSTSVLTAVPRQIQAPRRDSHPALARSFGPQQGPRSSLHQALFLPQAFALDVPSSG